MGQITNGIVTFSRTLNLGDYNSKKAEVQLAFAAEDGNYEAVLKLAGNTAIAKVSELLALAAPAKVAEVNAPSGQNDKAALAVAAGAPAEPAKALKAVKPPKTPPATKPEPEAITDNSADEDMTDILGAGDEPKPDVTDEELTTKVTRKAAECKNPKAIRELVARYAGPLPSGVRQVPKDKRHEFLGELAKITAPT